MNHGYDSHNTPASMISYLFPFTDSVVLAKSGGLYPVFHLRQSISALWHYHIDDSTLGNFLQTGTADTGS